MRLTPGLDTLFYGDNLTILRNEIEDESVDLVYLDPPFNSNEDYNILFKSPTGDDSGAQIEAFDDTWHWTDAAERAFDEVIHSGNSDAAEMIRAMRTFLKENDMMAYLAMMAVRLIELHRVLKSTGSLYLHCDPTASHYLKLLLDSFFGARNFKREIIWRSGWVSGFKTRAKNWIRNHDVIFYYLKDHRGLSTFNKVYIPHPSNYQRRGGGENSLGIAIDDVWDDPKLYSPNIKSFSKEKLGYPTQKPVALLERIIKASSNEGDLVLDPFCGCGTTIHAAEKLNRQWIGIDITHLAIGLIRRRLIDAFPHCQFDVQGVPKDVGGAHELASQDKHQFQLWALAMIEAQPFKGGRKGADGGVDGYLYFKPDGKMTEKVVVSVKGGEHVDVKMIRDLIATIDRERAKLGIFVTLAKPTKPMIAEAAAAGLYESPLHGKFSKIQILTIEDLFAGHRPDMPFRDPSIFKQAKREAGEDKQMGLDV
jgi:DNA modification methylase